jgi:KDO2-lipid IV(A) lauroyltransferase
MTQRVLPSPKGYFALLAIITARLIASCLSVETASSVGGRIARMIGPRTRRHRLALRNIERAFPDLGPGEHARVAEEMWSNFGETIAESLILDRIAKCPERVVFDPASEALSDKNRARPTVYVGLHFGNWEMTVIPARGSHRNLIGIYKPLKNRRLNRWLLARRTPLYPAGLLPATRQTVTAIIRHVRGGGAVCLLGDHRDKAGAFVPFFGLANASATFPALLAVRYGATLVAARVDRSEKAHFSVHLEEISVARSGNKPQDIVVLTAALQSTFERWIRERPGQWMWFSKRWAKSAPL